jgi:hypothetical protein
MPGHFENSFASQQPVHPDRHGPVQPAYNQYFLACFCLARTMFFSHTNHLEHYFSLFFLA